MEMVKERWPHVCRLSVRRAERPQGHRESDRNHPHLLLLPHSTLVWSCESFAAAHSRPYPGRACECIQRPQSHRFICSHARVSKEKSSGAVEGFAVSHNNAGLANGSMRSGAAPARAKFCRRHPQSGPAPPWHRSRKGDKRPNPRAADLQRSVKQKSQRAVQGGGIDYGTLVTSFAATRT
jgi:hypothetical protein